MYRKADTMSQRKQCELFTAKMLHAILWFCSKKLGAGVRVGVQVSITVRVSSGRDIRTNIFLSNSNTNILPLLVSLVFTG